MAASTRPPGTERRRRERLSGTIANREQHKPVNVGTRIWSAWRARQRGRNGRATSRRCDDCAGDADHHRPGDGQRQQGAGAEAERVERRGVGVGLMWRLTAWPTISHSAIPLSGELPTPRLGRRWPPGCGVLGLGRSHSGCASSRASVTSSSLRPRSTSIIARSMRSTSSGNPCEQRGGQRHRAGAFPVGPGRARRVVRRRPRSGPSPRGREARRRAPNRPPPHARSPPG